MCLCTTSHHNSSDNISRQPTTTTMNMNMNMNTMSPPTSSSPVIIKNIGSEDGMISWNDITIQEDDTCYLLSIDMPNVHGKDVTITLENNIITISGYRRCCGATTRSNSRSLSFSSTATENSNSSTSTSSSSSSSEEQQYQEEDYYEQQQQQEEERSYHKRQRLVSRRLEIDATVIDIDRAIAKTWNGSLTLYAPKR